MRQHITAAQTKLQELQDRHTAATELAQTTLDKATRVKREAYERLLRARASGAADVSELHIAHEKATTALQAAQLEADTSSTVAAMLEPQLEDAKAELTQAESDHAAARLDALKEAQRVERERYAKAQEEMMDADLKGVVIHNRLARLLRTKDGFYDHVYHPISFDREMLLTKGKIISRYEAEIEVIGE
ncbi:hypothetical protein EBAPG3_009350 [Nitrosospira lacus]|uniref:Uncharacterized protein n=2 Tax=Nitrosospira lacus TaxID=1288494 RepID=A0A1W6SQ82_9PROT|nr:hypothetical protein EBAPG3_009350 [Nitrosospira lacus]